MYIFGIIILFYYYVVGFINGFNTSFVWLWLILGLFYSVTFLYRKNRFYKIIKYLSLIIFIVIMIFEFNLIYNMRDNDIKNLDYILILGASVKGNMPSDALNARISRAYEYLKENENTVVIATGGIGKGENISEGEVIANELIKMGVDKNRIITENKSTTTVENIKNSISFINFNSDVGIVSSDYHIFRAKEICRSLGIKNIYGLGTKSNIFLMPHNMLREFVTFCIDVLIGNIVLMKF